MINTVVYYNRELITIIKRFKTQAPCRTTLKLESPSFIHKY
jgi:hypothetical protein